MYVLPEIRDARTVRHLARLFDDTLDRFLAPADAAADGARSPALDVHESEAGYTVQLDMPGIRKADIQVQVEGRQVRIKAERSAVPGATEGERLVHRERAPARYARSFALAQDIDADAAAAQFEDGVLTLTLPKRGAKAVSQVTVR